VLDFTTKSSTFSFISYSKSLGILYSRVRGRLQPIIAKPEDSLLPASFILLIHTTIQLLYPVPKTAIFHGRTLCCLTSFFLCGFYLLDNLFASCIPFIFAFRCPAIIPI